MTTATPDDIARAAIEACAQFFELGSTVARSPNAQAFLAMAADDLRENKERIASATLKILAEQ